jgi:sec-independent protein translocase protein TatB
MFDFAWSEIALIGVVALIAIGPKDLPVAMKTISEVIKKARRMAGEFQTHVDEMVREADLGEVRDSINQIRSFDLKGVIKRTIDEDGSLERTLREDPFATTSASTGTTPTTIPAEPAGDVLIETRPEVTVTPEAEHAPVEASSEASAETSAEVPAFIPPEAARPKPDVPAFIPPEIVQAASRPAPLF